MPAQNGVLGTIEVKEGETVNVGSLLGTINENVRNESGEIKEVKSYNPPKKQVQKHLDYLMKKAMMFKRKKLAS